MLKNRDLTYNFIVFIVLFVSNGLTLTAQNTKPSAPMPNNEAARLTRFEQELEQLRSVLKIPGISAGVVKDGQLIWSKGFGYSDYENKIAATASTPYEIASLTKTFAGLLLMQLVEQGEISLDDPMSKYSASYKDEAIKVRHVLSHTSEGMTPGERYSYNGNLFANLFDVIVKGSGKRFRLLIGENILDKLATTDTSPGNDVADNPASMAEQIGEARTKNYAEALKRLAKPHRLYGADDIVPTYNNIRGLNPSTGMISSVIDLAKYDAALDSNLFVKKQTQEQMWTPTVLTDGKPAPYGLGWFVQQHRGLKYVWHYGNLPNLYSALLLKIPEKRLTFIVLANSDALSSPFRLGTGNVLNSAFADSFLRSFVFEEEQKASLPAPTWGSDKKTFLSQIKSLGKNTRGYNYELETAANEAIESWLETRRNEAHNAIRLDPKIYDGYVGQYQVGANPPFKILNENGRLIREGRTRIELFPESETAFFTKAIDAQFIFVKDEKGQATQLKIRQGESELTAEKVPAAAENQKPDKKNDNAGTGPSSLKETLISLEKQSWEAFKNHDGKFFQEFLSDEHVDVTPGGLANKARIVQFVASAFCVTKNYSGDKFEVTMLDPNTAMLTYRAEKDTVCNGQPVPSPVWITSIYVKRGERWLNAVFQQTGAPANR